jgi:hypothetical protein
VNVEDLPGSSTGGDIDAGTVDTEDGGASHMVLDQVMSK